MRDQYKALSDNAIRLSEEFQAKSEKAYAETEKKGYEKMAVHYHKESKKYLAAMGRFDG